MPKTQTNQAPSLIRRQRADTVQEEGELRHREGYQSSGRGASRPKPLVVLWNDRHQITTTSRRGWLMAA